MARTEAFLISNLCPVSISLSHDSGACVEYLMLAREDATDGYLLARHLLSHLCRRKRQSEHHMLADVLIDSFARSRGVN